MDGASDRDALPSNLQDYAFGAGTRAGIAILGNGAAGFDTLSRPLRYDEVHETLEACLNQELHMLSPQSKKQRKPAIARLWAELDDRISCHEILAHHRRLYYAWGHDAQIDPLGVCVIDGAMETLDDLLAEGQPINAPTGSTSPLHLAVDDESESMTRALLARGAMVDAIDARGRSPLNIAAERGAASLVSALIAAGADPRLVDEDGQTALIIAAQRGHCECVRLLLPTSPCDHQDANGRTAMDAAATDWPELAAEINAHSEREILDKIATTNPAMNRPSQAL